MSNKRNWRRIHQRIRAEISRRPTPTTKSVEALIASQPAERARKERDRRMNRPTKKERREREVSWRRFAVLGRPRRLRKCWRRLG